MPYTYADLETRVRKVINSDVADVSSAIDNAIDFLGNFYENHKIDTAISTVANQVYIEKPALCKEVVRVQIGDEEYKKITASQIEETKDFDLKRFLDYNEKIQLYPTPTAIYGTSIWYKAFFTPLEGVAAAETDVPNNLIPLLVSVAAWFFFEQQESMYDYEGADGWISVTDTWTFLSDTDNPIFTVTVPAGATTRYTVGMKLHLVQTTHKYFVIVKVENTKLTLYGGTDYVLTNAIISQIKYSTARTPKDFPINPEKWQIKIVDATLYSVAAPAQNAWNNLGSLGILLPIGLWDVSFDASLGADNTVTSRLDSQITLSTSTSNESDQELTACVAGSSTAPNAFISGTLNKRKTINITTPTQYYLIERCTAGVIGHVFVLGAAFSTTIIKARCAYL